MASFEELKAKYKAVLDKGQEVGLNVQETESVSATLKRRRRREDESGVALITKCPTGAYMMSFAFQSPCSLGPKRKETKGHPLATCFRP